MEERRKPAAGCSSEVKRMSVRPRELAICGTEAIVLVRLPFHQASTLCLRKPHYNLSKPGTSTTSHTWDIHFLVLGVCILIDMAPPPSSSEWGPMGGGDVDTIDLTLSSPEPEEGRRLPPQRQHLPSYFMKEPGADSRVKREQGAPGPRLNGSRSHTPAINPQHLARMLDTTEPRALKSMLLELCKHSPALSQAVARGLAPYSMYAQGLIKQHQANLRASAARPVKQEKNEAEIAYERTRQRLAAQTAARGSSQTRAQPSSGLPSARGSQPTPRPRNTHSNAFQSLPRMKVERRFEVADSDSDQDQYIPDEFPVSTQRMKTERLPIRHTASPNTANRTRPIPLTERLARVQGGTESNTATKSCTQCHKLVEDEAGLCLYHPNPELEAAGLDECPDCIEPWSEEGCAVGMHVIEKDAHLDAQKRQQPSRSQSPSKRPRVS
jgi:hypothetical protein